MSLVLADESSHPERHAETQVKSGTVIAVGSGDARTSDLRFASRRDQANRLLQLEVSEFLQP